AQLPPIHAKLAGASENRVVDVSDVLEVRHRPLRHEPSPRAEQGIELDESEGVAEVRRVVRPDAAHLQLGGSVGEWLLRTAERVEQLQYGLKPRLGKQI